MSTPIQYDAHAGWSFAWSRGAPYPYITGISSLTRRECIKAVERELQMSWRLVYRRGGRIVKTMTVQA